MSLSFSPPDWLLQEFENRRNQTPNVFDSVNRGFQNYSRYKTNQTEDELKRQQLENERQRISREGRAQFYKYGDVASLPPEYQAQIGQPVQGPITETGVGPMVPPYIQAFNDFLKNYPQGTEGTTTDTIMRPLPEGGYRQETVRRQKSGKVILDRAAAMGAAGEKPRTFQEKQEIYDNDGNPVGYMVFDTKSGTKNFVPYQAGAIPQGGTFGPKVKPQVPAGETSKLGELENLSQKMSVLMQNYNPSFVGMVDAPIQALKQKTGFGASEKAANFRQTSQDLKDSLLRARSGAQINEQEYQRLLPLVPNEMMSEVDFMAKAKRFNEVLNEIYNSKKKAFTESGYRTQGMTGIPQQNGGPEIGEVRKGYRFKGGNPSDPKSWERI